MSDDFYGLNKETVKRLIVNGVISPTAVRNHEIKAEFESVVTKHMRKRCQKTAAKRELAQRYRVSVRTIERALRQNSVAD